MFGWGRYNYIPTQSICFCEWKASISYTFFMVLVCFGGPCSTMAFCYIRILREIRESKRRLQNNKQSEPDKGIAWIPAANKLNQEGQSAAQDRETSVGMERLASPKQVKLIKSGIGERGVRFALPSDESRTSAFRNHREPSDTFMKKNQPSVNVVGPCISNVAERPAVKQSKADRKRSEGIKLTRTFLVIILTFIILWFPFCVAMFISVFSKNDVPRIPDMITIILGCLNSCCNPIVYGVMNKRFRDAYAKLYCSTCKRRRVEVSPFKTTNDFSDTV